MFGSHDYFAEKFEKIEIFLLNQEVSVMQLLIDPEMHQILFRYLQKRDDDSSFPHILIGLFQSFRSAREWGLDILSSLNHQIEVHKSHLVECGVNIKQVSPGVLPIEPWREFLAVASYVSKSLPDNFGSVVFLVSPEEVTDEQNWPNAVKFLLNENTSPWLKFIVIDPRTQPRLTGLADHPRITTELFWLSPDEIEERAETFLLTG